MLDERVDAANCLRLILSCLQDADEDDDVALSRFILLLVFLFWLLEAYKLSLALLLLLLLPVEDDEPLLNVIVMSLLKEELKLAAFRLGLGLGLVAFCSSVVVADEGSPMSECESRVVCRWFCSKLGLLIILMVGCCF